MQKYKSAFIIVLLLTLGAGITFAAQKLLPDRVYLADRAYSEVTEDLSFIRGQIGSLEKQEDILIAREEEKFCTLVAIKIADGIPIKSEKTMPRYKAECLGLYRAAK